FNATDFLERSRNGRIVFAGDSIGRNQWESLICMLAQGVSTQSTIYEDNGNPISKHKGYLSIRFAEYNLTVEYYRVPFLVVTGRPPPKASKEVRTTLRVDTLHWYSNKWVKADVLMFSAGHWWNQDKTVKMYELTSSGVLFPGGRNCEHDNGCDGSISEVITDLEVMGNSEFRSTEKSYLLPQLLTGALQAASLSLELSMASREKNISGALRIAEDYNECTNSSYSIWNGRDGTWNEGGHCDANVAPETNNTKLEPDPVNNLFISDVIKQMESAKRKIQFLNITYLAEFRKDGHPSSHREVGTPIPAPQDCSHWCLPGVPDTWNELLYAQLLSNGFRTKIEGT
ncbi:unnamed protein product, partial [Ilex paraguariensis]